MDTKCHLELNPKGKDVDQKLYRSMIGSLLYLCASRPDIVLSVGVPLNFSVPSSCRATSMIVPSCQYYHINTINSYTIVSHVCIF